MEKALMNLFMFLAICFVAYLLFRGLNYNLNFKEGLTNETTTTTTTTTVSDGIAGNAATYAAIIKAETVKLQDTFLISKYRKDYENIILNLDDYADTLMLKTVLNIDKNNPINGLHMVSIINQAKSGLNSVMKFIDASH
jgi:preprotein translocase subunit SecF